MSNNVIPAVRHCGVLLCILFALTGCGGGGGGGSAPEPATAISPQSATTNNSAVTTQNSTVLQQAPAATEIKLLALYTSGLEQQFTDPDLRVQHLVNVANDVAAQSGVELNLILEHIEWVDYPDHYPISQALDDLTLASHASLNHIPALRDQVEADLVVLVRPYANDGNCGYAWIGGYDTEGDFSNPAEADYGFSVVAGDCSDYTLLHEVGHNMGLAHSRRESPDGGTYDYAVGHGLDSDFVTIMASPTEFNATQLPRFSSPSLVCNGNPCGVAHTNAVDGADAVRTINVSKLQVAEYR
jgi:hypothetical protein